MKIKNLYKKQGFRQWKSVWFLTGCMILVAIMGRGYGVIEEKSKQMDYFKGKFEEKEKKVEDVLRENQELRNKLENSSKVQVPEATKNVVRFYIKKYFGDKADEAEKIFTCESGLSPTSLHINKAGLGADYGVAQINNKYHAARFTKMFDVDWETGIYDISINLAYAKYLYDNSGWNPWVCSRII